ncbi:MAG: hypothetical protein ACREDY_26435 [Bradyrhizobium sp.]
MTFFRILMWPANAACDRLGLEDENERGMVRMLVNTLLWTAIGVTIFMVAWMMTA